MNNLNIKNQYPKLFWDTANLTELEKGLKTGILSGITTNPPIVAMEPMISQNVMDSYLAQFKKIIELCKRYKQEVPISIMVFESEPEKMLEQAKEFAAKLNYRNLNVKIPIGWQEMRVIKELEENNIKVNVTVGMSEAQTALAASTNPTYFSIFYNHIKDSGGDPSEVIANSRKLLEGNKTEIIVGSIRSPKDVIDSFLAGAHIVTAPPSFFEQMAFHPKTPETVQQFLEKFSRWGK